MAQVVDSVVQYTGKEARELFFEPVIGLPTFQSAGIKVVEDIQSRLFLYYSSKLDKITKKRDGCGNVVSGTGADISRRPIDVVDMEVFLPQCADEFNQTIYETAKKKGVDINDLSDTEIEDILIKLVTDATARDLQRQVWFNDTSLVANDDYNAYDGLFKHIIAAVAANTVVNVPISFSMTTSTDAATALYSVHLAQPLAMKAQPAGNKKFLVSRNIFDLYVAYLATVGQEPGYDNLVNGVLSPKCMGIPVIPMDVWDAYFTADFPADFGQGRIILHVSDLALTVGMDATTDATEVKSWYDINSDLQKFRVRYKVGTTLHYHEMLVVSGFESNS